MTLVMTTSCSVHAQDTLWQKIKPYFSPPSKYAKLPGKYRSPLVFYDGKKVKTRADWQKRRREIFERWQNIMGKWPEVIHTPKFQIIDSIHKENYTQFSVKFEWRKEELSSGYLLVPDGKNRKAAVVIVYYEPETAIGLTDRANMDLAVQLARRGIAAFSIGADPVAKTRPYGQYYPTPDSAIVQPLSMLGYLAANAWNALSHLSFIDSSRIGITGHSYGSKWAMFASCLYDKFACAAWSDGGIVFDESRPNVNYQDPWYLGYYPPPWRPQAGTDSGLYHSTPWGMAGAKDKGAYAILRNQGYDLHELHALMPPRPFLVSGGSEDPPERWIALNHTIRVNTLLGYKHRVGMTHRLHHEPTAQSNDEICTFFEYFLKNNPAVKIH
jgi:hypothetical protein